ncbi:MAG: uroporphyrinogen-III synthase [Novosphingobium sp.]
MVPLVVIRPEPGCAASLAAARAVRLEAHGFPLFAVVAKSWEAPLPGHFDAILGGSGNAFRHGGKGLAILRDLPVYAVGETTASAAREAGFAVAAIGNGGMQGLLAELQPGHRRLLRIAGDERVPLTLPRGVTMEERVVYASVPRPMPPDLIALLRAPAMVALHSADAARHVAAQCVTHGIRRSLLRLIALSQRIASAAGDGWGEVAVASLPNDKALLALALQMCQDPGPRGRD